MREKRMRKEAEHQKDYRLQKSKMMAEREAESDLYKSQRVCEQLDEDQVLRKHYLDLYLLVRLLSANFNTNFSSVIVQYKMVL